MIRNINTTNLTKNYIESKISQELIVSKYLDIPLDVVKDCIEHNNLIQSVFRDNDTNGSMGIQYNQRGRLKVRDFGGFGFFGDIYDVVSYVLSIAYGRKIEPNSKQDFYFILKHIANTFKDLIENKEVDENVTDMIKGAIAVGKQRRPIIEIVPRSWNKKDKEYWNSLGVSLGYLNTHFVIPVEQYYVDRGVHSDPKYYYKEKDPCYAYMLGQNLKGISFIKLYFPKRNRATELKFITNCNVLEGLLNLELNNYDYILITKSSKDRLSIGSHLSSQPFYGGGQSQLKIGVVNLPSENYKLKEKEYNWLSNKLAANGKILSLLDFDYTGRLGAKYLYDTYDIPYLFITRGELGLPNYGCKDFAELHNKYTVKEINQFIKETIDYVEIRFRKDVPDTFADYSGLPYFD
jgi:hypothetical protein